MTLNARAVDWSRENERLDQSAEVGGCAELRAVTVSPAIVGFLCFGLAAQHPARVRRTVCHLFLEGWDCIVCRGKLESACVGMAEAKEAGLGPRNGRQQPYTVRGSRDAFFVAGDPVQGFHLAVLPLMRPLPAVLGSLLSVFVVDRFRVEQD
jgi:hypothetical protein